MASEFVAGVGTEFDEDSWDAVFVVQPVFEGAGGVIVEDAGYLAVAQ